MAIVREREPQLGTPYLAVLAESAPKVNGVEIHPSFLANSLSSLFVILLRNN